MLITDRFSLSKRKKTDEGYLLVTDNRVARTGILKYTPQELGLDPKKYPSGIVRAYRGKEQLFTNQVKDSFKSKPVTLDHPSTMVNPENFKTVSVGVADGEVRIQDEYLVMDLAIYDQDTIKAIESGKVEISLGYTSDIREVPGVSPEGEAYDVILDNIKGNHIAIVDAGRCGAPCAISDQNTIPKHNKQKAVKMAKFVVDGVTYEADAQVSQVVTNLQEKNKAIVDAKNAEIEQLKDQHKKVLDEKQAKIDDLEENKMTEEDIEDEIRNREDAISDAKTFLGDKEVDLCHKNVDQIKKAAVEAMVKDKALEGKSQTYFDARFDILVEDAKTNKIKTDYTTVSDAAAKSNSDQMGLSPSAAAQMKRAEKNKTIWKSKGA